MNTTWNVTNDRQDTVFASTVSYISQHTNFSFPSVQDLQHSTNISSTNVYLNQNLSTDAISTTELQRSISTASNDLTTGVFLSTTLSVWTSENSLLNSTYSSTTQNPEIELLSDVSSYLWKIFCPILFLVGMVGNILTLTVLRRMRFWKKPSIFALAPLAMADMTVLCTGLSRYWINEMFDFDLRVISNAGCKINLFVIYISMQYSSWIVVTFTVERFLKTNYPFKHRIFVTVKKEVLTLFIVFLVLIGVDGHYFWSNGLMNNGTECTSVTPAFFHFEEYVFVYIDLTVLSLLPAIIMIFMNIGIARALKKSRDFVQRSSRGSASRHYQKFNRKLTRMLLFTSTYFVCATIPISVYFIVDSYTKSVDELGEAQKDVAWSVTYIFQFSNYSMNFFLYTASNARFRRHLEDILKRRRLKKIVRSLQSSTNTSSTRIDDNSVTETETQGLDSQTSDRDVSSIDITLEIGTSKIDRDGSAERGELELNNVVHNELGLNNDVQDELDLKNIVHGESKLNMDVHGESELNKDVHGESELNKDVHGESELNKDVLGESELNIDVHGESELNKYVHGESELNKDVHGESELNKDVHGESELNNDVHGGSELNNDVHGELKLNDIVHSELELNNTVRTVNDLVIGNKKENDISELFQNGSMSGVFIGTMGSELNSDTSVA